jgi:nitric oxide reductase activation protein
VSEASSADDGFEGIDLSELRRSVTISEDETEQIREKFAEVINQDRGLYDNTVREVSSVINELSSELRAVFEKRRKSHREAGRPSGPKLNINRFIREKTSGKHPIETRAFEAKTRPLERDYAVLLLVDVSGSMQDKIHHAFAATVACTEALTDLSIEHSIVGFNDMLYPYKSFGEAANPDKISAIESDVDTAAARYNNDGWALQQALKQLTDMPQKELILIVLSDGVPEPSKAYAGPAFDLKKTALAIEQSGKVRLIGLGMGPGTEHVQKFYRNNRANIPIDNLAQQLSEVIKEIISS